MNKNSIASLLVFASVAFGLPNALFGNRANAFDYSEHARITTLAIGEARAQANYTNKVEMLFASLTDVLNRPAGVSDRPDGQVPGVLCPGLEMFAESPARCFALGDVVALAGDHSSSPEILKWRWFNQCITPRHSLVHAVGSGLANLGKRGTQPELRMSTAVADIPMFRRVARESSLANLGRVPQMNDAEIASKYDSNYVSLAESNNNHFRRPVSNSTPGGALTVLRRESGDRFMGRLPNRPALDAIAWYSDLHQGAIEYVRNAAGQPAGQRRFLLGMASLFELYALHFLEDSASAGHLVVDANEVSNGTKNRTHDDFCKMGVEVIVPPTVCAKLPTSDPKSRYGELARICQSGNVMKLYGDHSLFDRPDLARATLQYATLLAAESIKELVDEIDAGNVPKVELAKCLTSMSTQSPSPKWTADNGACEVDDAAVYRCADAWWESGGATRASLIQSQLSPIIAMLPVLVEVATQLNRPTAVSFAAGYSATTGSAGDKPVSLPTSHFLRIGALYDLAKFGNIQGRFDVALKLAHSPANDNEWFACGVLRGGVSVRPYDGHWAFGIDLDREFSYAANRFGIRMQLGPTMFTDNWQLPLHAVVRWAPIAGTVTAGVSADLAVSAGYIWSKFF